MQLGHQGFVHQVSMSHGGVPKLSVESADVTPLGLVGDKQNDTKHHGGPDRAVCLYSHELIEELRAEGHPITPGAIGENLTLSGLDWSRVVPGARLRFASGLLLEVTSYTTPCSTIRAAFRESQFNRVKQELNPGCSRVYARVLNPGPVRPQDSVVIAEHA